MDIAMNPHGQQSPSPWVTRFGGLVKPAGRVLDVAAGYGRYSKWFFEQNCQVVAVDVDLVATFSIASTHPDVQVVNADIERGPWPLLAENGLPQQFDAVVVTNYLWRPLFPVLLASLAPGGVLIYETFAAGNETVGKPSRPDFLLRQGELLELCKNLRVVAYEHGFLPQPDRYVQRICALNQADAFGRYLL
jgi:SAM-dependent methyltransferase